MNKIFLTQDGEVLRVQKRGQILLTLTAKENGNSAVLKRWDDVEDLRVTATIPNVSGAVRLPHSFNGSDLTIASAKDWQNCKVMVIGNLGGVPFEYNVELHVADDAAETTTAIVEIPALDAGGTGGGGGGGMIEITHADLVALRDAGQLVAGQQYRITDYVATTIDPESRSANHPFDIIVTADDERTLNESARAIAHAGDTYFEKCNLAAWRLQYCLDNDQSRFAWAQSEDLYGYFSFDGVVVYVKLISSNDNSYAGCPYKFQSYIDGAYVYIYSPSLDGGNSNAEVMYGGNIIQQFQAPIEIITIEIKPKGVVYHMTDEHNNSAPFDFKGIQIAVYYGIMRGSDNGVYTTDGEHNKFVSLEFRRYSYLFTQSSDSNNADNSVEELYGFAQNNKFGCKEGILLHAVCCTKEWPVVNCYNLSGNYWYADYLCTTFALFDENEGWTSDSNFIAEKRFVDVYNKGQNKYLGNCYSLNCMCDNSIMLGSIIGESESCLQIQASSSLVYQVDNTILTKKISDLLS